MAGSMNW